jgi:enamine deaminase RidA (YjgF/YER057c/UK114 family)
MGPIATVARMGAAMLALGGSTALPAAEPEKIKAPGGEAVLLGEQERMHYDRFHFSGVRRAGDTLYLSGVVVFPREANQDFRAAVRAAFQNIGAQLEAAGSDFGHVVMLQTFHVWTSPFGGGSKSAQFEAFAAVKDEFVKAPYPAWTAVGVTELLPDSGAVEIQVTALVARPRG